MYERCWGCVWGTLECKGELVLYVWEVLGLCMGYTGVYGGTSAVCMCGRCGAVYGYTGV